MRRKINQEIASSILHEMPLQKKQSLKNALDRNESLTSARVLSIGDITVYKEGWYLQLYGTRCQFSVYAEDNDGTLIFKRKPKEKCLDKLYKQTLYFNEHDFKEFKNI